MARVLVAVDGSEQAEAAVDYAAEEFAGGTLVLLHVVNPTRAGYGGQAGIPATSEGWLEDRQADAEDLFDDLRAGIDGPTVETTVEVGHPSRTIVTYAEDEGVDHIVMGSHGREGLTRILLGSVAENVVRRAPCPVTVVR